MGNNVARLEGGPFHWEAWPPPVPGVRGWVENRIKHRGDPASFSLWLTEAVYVVADEHGYVQLRTNGGRWRDGDAQGMAEMLSDARDIGLRWGRVVIVADDGDYVLDACQAAHDPVRVYRAPDPPQARPREW